MVNTMVATLDTKGLQRFLALHDAAVKAVVERFYTMEGSAYERFGESGRQACQEDLRFHLDFLRPVLEFGMLQPLVDYLVWLNSVLVARSVPADHLALSLDWLADFFAQAMEGEDGRVVVQALMAAKEGFLQVAGTTTPSPESLRPSWPESSEFEGALLRGDQREALIIVHRLMDAGRNLVDIELHLIQPVLYHIGELWQNNQITVAQEHIATAIVQMIMAVGLVRSPPSEPIQKKVLLACVEGNWHVVGLAMVSDAFALSGWQVQYLGANVPTSSLVSQVLEFRPDLVGLSVSFPQQLRVAKQAITTLREKLGATCPAVMLGGQAINRFQRLAGLLGADTCSTDARLAVSQAGHLLL